MLYPRNKYLHEALRFRDSDRGRVLENIILLQLLFDGYSVSIGKLYDKEVDFVAIKNERKLYIQVTETIVNEQTQTRELLPLLSIRDAYEKIVIVGDGNYPANIDGVRIVSAAEYVSKGVEL